MQYKKSLETLALEVYSIIDNMSYTKPFRPSQGEDEYTVVRNGSIEMKLAKALADDATNEFITTKARYRVLPSSFGNDDYVIYKYFITE